jgi:lambda family phage portal protein
MGLFNFFKKKKQQTTASKKSYSGAQFNNSLYSWAVSNTSADKEIQGNLPVLRARARDLARNNDYVKKFLRMLKTNVVGKGIKLQNKAKLKNGNLDKRSNDLIENSFKKWSKKGICDVTGKYSFVDIQKLAISQMALDGEIFIRIIKGYKNGFNFALQLIEADHLDINYNDYSKNIVMGIEFDQWGKPIAYHMYKKHPGDVSYFVEQEKIRIPADEIIHLFIPARISQNRGIPWLHTAIIRLQMLGAYEEAELVASRLSAAKGGFYKKPPEEQYGGEVDEKGNLIQEVEPGMFEVLPSGWDFVPFDLQHPNSAFEKFEKAVLRGIASGLDVSYNYLANDLENVNYSSIRAGVLDEREVYKELQLFLIEHLLNFVFENWLEMSLLSRAIPLNFADFERLNSPTWITRGWEWVDPLKDMQANVLAIKAGLKTASQVVSEMGYDYEEILLQLKREKELREKYGITTISDAEILEAISKIKDENDGKN